MKSVSLGTAALLTLITLGADAADTFPVNKTGGMLVDSKGMTVYTYDKDTARSDKSACYGKCAENWPPVLAVGAQPAPADFSTFKRADGSTQIAYKGKPLYTFVKDKKAGDKVGDKVGDVWHVVTD
jgi:predicted lipoprotein with Yx(FWY)xxD motif